ncbi:DUF5667 domain-containing protein [Nocardioides sp. 616]|uniref:DUF5667 domain-containing protein n=1 Tax=Nocardioides sp. 616 TaxID=2268090 RepID=UPI000CE53918|nr:DUF5667 domain-containing protein [Nocardioides sp. 616]
MRAVFRAGRAAERFQSVVESGHAQGSAQTPAQTESSGSHADQDRLLAVVGQLRAVELPDPRAHFVTSLRERLMAEADTVLLPAPTAPQRPTLTVVTRPRTTRDRRVAAILTVAAALSATGSLALSAQAALPGDSLYPVKRVMESAQAGLVLGEQDKGELLLAKAELRLNEVEDLLVRDSWESRQATASALQSFSDQSDEAGTLLLENYADTQREGSVVALLEFTGRSMARLEALSELVPGEAADELATAADQLLRIDALARQACPGCAGGGITEFPVFLAASGPMTSSLYEPDGVTFAAPAPAPLARGNGAVGRSEGDVRVDAARSGPATSVPSATAEPSSSGAPTDSGQPTTGPHPTSQPTATTSRPAAPTESSSSGPSRTQAPGPTVQATPTPTTLVDDVTTIVVGDPPTSSGAPESSGGLVGTIGEVLETATTGLLGEKLGGSLGAAVDQLGGAVGTILGSLGSSPSGGQRP